MRSEAGEEALRARLTGRAGFAGRSDAQMPVAASLGCPATRSLGVPANRTRPFVACCSVVPVLACSLE